VVSRRVRLRRHAGGGRAPWRPRPSALAARSGAGAVVPPRDAPVGPHEHRGAGTEPVARRERRPCTSRPSTSTAAARPVPAAARPRRAVRGR
jgi:hypothetical protein